MMDNAIINKILKFNNSTMVNLSDDPLLNEETSLELSKSIVKILALTNKNPESTTSKTFRRSILEYTKKLCTVDNCPVLVDTSNLIFETVMNSYLQRKGFVYENCNFSNEHDLLEFMKYYVADNLADNSSILMDNSADVLNLSYAVFNLDKNNPFLKHLISKCSSYDSDNEMISIFLKKVWLDKEVNLNSDLISKLSNRLASYIENLLLNVAIKVITFNFDMYTDEDLWKEICSEELLVLLEKCSSSCDLFQKCCKILNYAFIKSNFRNNFLCFLPIFISKIKFNKKEHLLYDLYEGNMSHIVSYMEAASYDEYFSTEDIHHSLADVRECLKLLIDEDLIMVLSHYPDWFNFYLNYMQNS